MDKSGLCCSYILRFSDFGISDDSGYDVELMWKVDNMKKKIVVLVLTLICILGLIGCGKKYEGPLSCISYTDFDGTVSLLDMPEEVHEEILAVLNGGVWHNDMPKCESDYSFETKDEKIYYHADCGTFSDVTNKRYMTLSEAEKANINQLLGVTIVCD